MVMNGCVSVSHPSKKCVWDVNGIGSKGKQELALSFLNPCFNPSTDIDVANITFV